MLKEFIKLATSQLINWLIISPARDRLATAHLSSFDLKLLEKNHVQIVSPVARTEVSW